MMVTLVTKHSVCSSKYYARVRQKLSTKVLMNDLYID